MQAMLIGLPSRRVNRPCGVCRAFACRAAGNRVALPGVAVHNPGSAAERTGRESKPGGVEEAAENMGRKSLNRSFHAAKATSRTNFTPSFRTSRRSCGITRSISRTRRPMQLRRSQGQQFLPLLLAQLREAETEKADHHLLQELRRGPLQQATRRQGESTSNTTATRTATASLTRTKSVSTS